jgi:hypothetical protein
MTEDQSNSSMKRVTVYADDAEDLLVEALDADPPDNAHLLVQGALVYAQLASTAAALEIAGRHPEQLRNDPFRAMGPPPGQTALLGQIANRIDNLNERLAELSP